MNKKALSERDICTKFITPAIERAQWDVMTQVREEVGLTKGRVIVRGKLVSRGTPKRADYVLFYQPNLPIAVIEAKDNNNAIGDGMQQALGYAEMLDVPFAYSSNGDGFLEHDRTGGTVVERQLDLDAFPSPAELWNRYRAWRGLSPELERVIGQPYYADASGKATWHTRSKGLKSLPTVCASSLKITPRSSSSRMTASLRSLVDHRRKNVSSESNSSRTARRV